MVCYELTEFEVQYKPNDEMIYLHGYSDDLKLFGVKIEEMNDEKVEMLVDIFNKLGLMEGTYYRD